MQTIFTHLDPINGLGIHHVSNASNRIKLYQRQHTLIVNLNNHGSIAAICPAATSLTLTDAPSEYLLLSIRPSRTGRLFGASESFHPRAGIYDVFLYDMALQLYETVMASGNRKPSIIDSLCTSLLMHLLAAYPRDLASIPRGSLKSSPVMSITDLMQSRLGKNMTMSA